MYEYVTVDMYATLVTFIGRNLIINNSSIRGKKCDTKYQCSPFLVPLELYTCSNFGPHTKYIVGGGYWQRFYRLVHMGALCCAPSFSVFLIYRYVKRNKLQIIHAIKTLYEVSSIWCYAYFFIQYRQLYIYLVEKLTEPTAVLEIH